MEMLLKVCAGSLLAAGGVVFWMINQGIFGKLWTIAWGGFPIWVIFTLVGIFGLVWKLKHEEFSWGEFVCLGFLVPLLSTPFVMSGYYFSTDLRDTEIMNGYIARAEYEEEYTTETTSTDSDGKETKSTTYHSPQWWIYTSNELGLRTERVKTDATVFAGLAQLFGNKREEDRTHLNQISIGDGDVWITDFDGVFAHQIPTAVEHEFVNYVKATDNILKVSGAMSGYEQYLIPYPRVHAGAHGAIDFDRVIAMGSNVPTSWMTDIDRQLDRVLMTMGKRKQVNVIVYFAAANQGFFQALEESWCLGKKNDVIVVIGMKQWPTVDWVQVMAWTDHKIFIEELKECVLTMGPLEGKAEEFVGRVVGCIEGTKGEGYERKPMSDYDYLVADIGLPWWADLGVTLIGCLLISPFVVFFIRN
jgi:hypothetical protein